MALFTQFKQWIDLITTSTAGSRATAVNGNAGAGAANSSQYSTTGDTIGAYFERVSGGETSYSVAEAAQANSRGQVYRTTRFRVSELSLEGQLDLDTFEKFCKAFESFRKNGNEKMTVRRVLADGDGNKLRYEYSGCSVVQPPSIDDGDVGRDQEFVMMRIRVQPEIVKVFRGDTKIMEFNPYETMDGSTYKGDKA